MAQGTKKLSKPATSKSKRHQVLAPKKGRRVIAPKKRVLIKQDQYKKKIAAELSAGTEKDLAEKAGHLEILRGGKKDKKKEAAKKGS